MKILPAILGVLIVLLLVALLFEHKKVADLQSTLVAVGDERDAMNRQIKALDVRITEFQNRQAAAPSIAQPRAEHAAASPKTPAAPVATPGVTVTAPAGWGKNGSKPGAYVVGVDQNQTWGGMPSAYVKSLESSVDGFGGMMQTTAADNYVGKRIRLSGWIKTEEANEGGGHLWLRVDGQQRGRSLQFDNMSNRAVKGTSDWQEGSVVLDVPEGASALAYGFFVAGGGTMWVSGTRIEVVGPEVPSTNMQSAAKSLPKSAVNLGFDPGKPN